MIKITNTGEQPRGLHVKAKGKISVIRKGETLEVSPADWDAIKDQPATAGLVTDGTLKIEGADKAATDGKPAKEKPAKGDAKTEGGPAQ